jgi:restriction system protein
LAARERERVAREAHRTLLAEARQAGQARKDAARMADRLAKSAGAERKRLEKEAREAHIAAQEAEVVERNGKLAEIYEEIDSLLAATLAIDDYVDLRSLRVVVQHPPFDRPDLESPTPPPESIPDPPPPELKLPPAPSGLAKLIGTKKHTDAVAAAERAHEGDLAAWRVACRDAASRRQAAAVRRDAAETQRIEALQRARERYARECAEREAAATEHNKRLLELIANLGYGAPEAVQEYVSIVLSNSAYPEHFPVSHDFEFDPATAELRLQVVVPGPESIPGVKSYRYAKAADEIVETQLSQKECRDRYAIAVYQVALRSFHEVFESDRRGLIRTISLVVGAKTIDRATGQRVYVPFVFASAERESFQAFDLSEVVPAATLQRLGASTSKNPYELVPALQGGVRRS